MVSLYRSWSLVQEGTTRAHGRDHNYHHDNNHNPLDYHHHHHGHSHLSLFRSHTRATSRESFACRCRSETPKEDLTSPSPFHVSQLSYSDQLEDYIIRYKRRPPDIKYWPYGPYWPRHFDGLLLNTPRHLWSAPREPELLAKDAFGRRLNAVSRTIDNQSTPYKGKWRGVQVAFDSERSSRDFNPLPVPEGCCPSLVFESRFECGNLRQARRVGQFEYELVLKPDLYTLRHTQWYYFRVTNAVPGITYKLRIVNLRKRDSLYNHGMRPLLYSENDAQEKQRGWVRTGHHIGYSRNYTNHNCPLLQRGVTYHMLEWQMEFHNADDTYYLAHCYPYSFTDLKEDLDVLMNSEERAQVTRRQVLCETRAGNSCFLITVTNFESKEEKKGIVISGRVHPGESQASWMMKGLLEFITGPDPEAQELRNKFIFKIVPMVNPDGVIVGNYRCSLAARDLNRNYRHPRRENFPVIWHIKHMVEDLAKTCEIALYCDLHGHSRKPNVFMYGNNTSTEAESTPEGAARAFISERLFPWLMGLRSPEKFHFKSCKFQIRRCKESTGRVVMWRQMKIFNSFTLEATFSGTVLNKESCRHFNILDFMEMGKVLAQTVLDYHRAQDDQTTQTQAVLGLTRVITEQILTSKGLIEAGTTLQDFSKTDPASLGASEAAKVQESAEKWTGALLALLNTPRNGGAVSKDAGTVTGSCIQALDERGSTGVAAAAGGPRVDPGGSNAKAGAETDHRPMFTREDVAQMLVNLSGGQSMEDCLSFLSEIGVQDAIDESDSSDSDSESEPEMKPAEPKARKKKRKSKKQRDKDHEKKLSVGEKRNSEEPRLKVLSNLPALSSSTRTGGSNPSSAQSDNSVMGSNKQASSYADKNRANRQMSSFISKYEGRHNGGVPCFTEERSMERAAKRLAELRRKMDDSVNGRDLTFYCVDESGMHPSTNEEFSQRLQELGEGNPGIAATLLGLNVRTGYTHAEHLPDSNPSPNALLGGNSGISPYLLSTSTPHGYHPDQMDALDQSFSDSCDNNSDYITDSNNTGMRIFYKSNGHINNDNGKDNISQSNGNTNVNTSMTHSPVNNLEMAGPFSIKSFRNTNSFKHESTGHHDTHHVSLENLKSCNTSHSGAHTNNNHLHRGHDSIHFSGPLSGNGVGGGCGLHSLPVTARKSPYVQLEPLSQRSASTLSLFKQLQGCSALVSHPTAVTTTAAAATTPSPPVQLKYVPGDASPFIPASSEKAAFNLQTTTSLNNSETTSLGLSARDRDISSKKDNGILQTTSQTSILESHMQKQKLGSLPSFSSMASKDYSGDAAKPNKAFLGEPCKSSTVLKSSGVVNGKTRSSKVLNTRSWCSLKASKRNTDSDVVARKGSHDVSYSSRVTPPDGSPAPPNIYTYFAVYSSMPGLNGHCNVESTEAKKLVNRGTLPGNQEDKADKGFNVDRLVNSLAQNLTSIDTPSGSTVAKRHARYKTTHLRSMSRSGGASSSSPLLASGCLPAHTSRLVLPDSLNSLTAAGPRVEDRARAAGGGRNSNLSLRGPSHTPNALHSSSYSWE